MEIAHAPIHFHSSDERFCGTKRQMRRFTFDTAEVTCPVCKATDAIKAVAESLPMLKEVEHV